MKKKIILTGSLAFDYIFDIDNHFSDYIQPDKVHQINISLTCETFEKSFGGTAGNQAYYLGNLGANPCVAASVGFDFQDYKKFLEKNKVNTDYIMIDKSMPTAAGHVITDKKDNQIWMFAKGAMKNADKLRISNLEVSPLIGVRPLKKPYRNNKNNQSDIFVLISPTEPQAMVNFVNECVKNNIDFAFDPAFYIPVLPVETLIKGIKNAKIIFGNDYEIAFLEKRTGQKMKKLLHKEQILIKTLGDAGSEIYYEKKCHKIGIYKTKAIDPTGAGDAYRAGFLVGYLNGRTIEESAKMAAVTASFAVEVKGTMNPKFSKIEFEKRLKLFS